MVPNKEVDFCADTYGKIVEAIACILAGTCARVDVNKNVKVYECKNIIRIDLKVTEEN